MRTLPVFLLCALLASCSIVPDRLAKASESVRDKPPAYQTGHAEGCESALTQLDPVPGPQAKWRRDDSRMKTDPDYALGWNDGRWKCKPY
jgi:hypothetical protein